MLFQNQKMMGMKKVLIAGGNAPPLSSDIRHVPPEALRGRQGCSGGEQGDGPRSLSIPALQGGTQPPAQLAQIPACPMKEQQCRCPFALTDPDVAPESGAGTPYHHLGSSKPLPALSLFDN